MLVPGGGHRVQHEEPIVTQTDLDGEKIMTSLDNGSCWSPERSAQLYRVREWGGEYFGVRSA